MGWNLYILRDLLRFKLSRDHWRVKYSLNELSKSIDTGRTFFRNECR